MMLRKNTRKQKQVANLQLVKETNLTLLFNLINRHEPVSRAELAHMTKLSPTTVSSLVEELLSNGFVIETGAGKTTTSGRKPIMLEVNPNGGCVASFELLEDGFLCYLYDLKCKQITGRHFAVEQYSSIGGCMLEAINSVLSDGKTAREKLLGICIGAPGIIDEKGHRVVASTVIPIDEENDFYDVIKQEFPDIPVLMGNESCFWAYAEKEYGTDGDIGNLVFIDINVGIGAGIIVNGEIFTGSFGMAGEIGHMCIDLNGPRCKCGNKGCLETLASIPAISQKLMFAMMSGRETVMKDIVGNDFYRINADLLRVALDKGDQLVMEVIDDTAVKLAFGINNIINLFNPQVIVIGGEISKLGEFLLGRVKENLVGIGLKPGVNRVKIKYSNLRGSSGTLGAARYVLDNIFKTEGLLSVNNI